MNPQVGTAKAARWLGLSERTVRDLCQKGKLEGAWQPAGFQGKWLISTECLRAIRPEPADPTLVADLADSADLAENVPDEIIA